MPPTGPISTVRPRPGVVKTLGICNILFATIGVAFLFTSVVWIYMALHHQKVETQAVVVTTTGSGSPRQMIPINMYFGMDDAKFLRFNILDVGTQVFIVAAMFTTGIGLLNLKRWGARAWSILAWVAILRCVLLGGMFILDVTPSLSETMAKAVVAMFSQPGMARRGAPTVQDMTRIYSVMCLIVGLAIVIFGSIYPAISLWVLGRPSVRAALEPRSSAKELDLP